MNLENTEHQDHAPRSQAAPPQDLPVLPYDNVADIPMEVIEELREQREAAMQQAADDAYSAQARTQTEVYNEQRDTTASPPNRVQCPLPDYKDIYVTYDLTKPYFYRFSQPRFESSLKPDPKSTEKVELWDDMEVLQRDFNRWMKRRAKWMRAFIKDIEGWSDDLTDGNDDPIPHPLIGGWQSYFDLFLAHTSLAEWMAERGYDTAMEASLKNSQRRLAATSEKNG